MSSMLYQIKSIPKETDLANGEASPLRMRLEGDTLDLIRQAGYVTDPSLPSYSQNQDMVHRMHYQDVIGAIKGKSVVASVSRIDVYADRICFGIKLNARLNKAQSDTKRGAKSTSSKAPRRTRRADLVYVVPFQCGMQLIAYGHIKRSAGAKTADSQISRIFALDISGDEHSKRVDVRLKLSEGVRHHDTYRVYG